MAAETKTRSLGLHELRARIDAADAALIDLLAKRGGLVDRVAAFKRGECTPMYAPERERAIVEAARVRAAELGLSPDLVEDIFSSVLAESHRRMAGH